MSITETEVRAALHHATDHLTSPPGLLDEVRRGGGRRLVRRRGALAALLVIGLVALTGFVRLPGSGPPLDVAHPLLDEPTRGDLANDRAYLDRLASAWRQAMSDVDGALVGQPHVVWAGTTPAGPAALMAQQATESVSRSNGARAIALTAFVQPTVDGPTLMGIYMIDLDADATGPQAALIGPDRDILVVLDSGHAVEYSPDFAYEPGGKIRRAPFQQVRFQDGAAVLRVPPQRTRVTIAIAQLPRAPHTGIHAINTSEILFPPGTPASAPPVRNYVLPGAERAWGPDPQNTKSQQLAEAMRPYYDTEGVHRVSTAPVFVYATTPDGRRMHAQTVQYDDDPAHLVALLGTSTGGFAVAGSVRIESPGQPVQVRLPDSQGVLVLAEEATLRYRIAGGDWQDAGRDAALLPADAAEVELTRSGATTTVPIG